MSGEGTKPVFGSEATEQHRICSAFGEVGKLQPPSEQLIRDNILARDKVDRTIDLAVSASVSASVSPKAANDQMLNDYNLDFLNDFGSSQIIKRWHDGSDVDQMLPRPPLKKLTGNSLSTAKPTNQDEFEITLKASIRPTSLLAATTVMREEQVNFNSKAQDSCMIDGSGNESGGSSKTTSENIAQPAAIDFGTKQAKEAHKNPDWYNSKRTFGMTTLRNKIGVSGMEEFFHRQGVDVVKEFPRTGVKCTNDEGEDISRRKAMTLKVREVHQAYIDARDAGLPNAPQGRTRNSFENKQPSVLVLTHSNSAPPPPALPSTHGDATSCGKKRQLVQDLHVQDEGAEVLSRARSDLQAIRRYAAERLSKAYKIRVQDSATEEKPIKSAKVECLVFDIVDHQIRLRMVPILQDHGADTDESFAGIISEMHTRRAELILELQRAINWKKGQDPVLLASRLVLQEFLAND